MNNTAVIYYTTAPGYYTYIPYQRPLVQLKDPNIKVGTLSCSEGGFSALFSAQHGWVDETVELHPLDMMIRHKWGSKPFDNLKIKNAFARQLLKEDVTFFREFSFGVYDRFGTLLIVFAAKSEAEMVEWIDAVNMVSRQSINNTNPINYTSTQSELGKAAIMECRHTCKSGLFSGDGWKISQLELYPSSQVLRRRDKGGAVHDINLIGKTAMKVDVIKAAHPRLHSFIIIDETGVELLQIAAGDEGDMNEWIRDINNVADSVQ